MRAALERQPWDVVLSDYVMPGFDALAALALLKEHSPGVPFIVVSGSVGEDTAVAAMKAGATDYLMKDRLQRLAPAVTRVLAESGVERERRRLEDQLLQSQRMEAVGQLAAGGAPDLHKVLPPLVGARGLRPPAPPGGPAARDAIG